MSIYRPYTYLLIHIPTETAYYGVRWKNVKLNKHPEEDLWLSYFSRSNKVRDLIEKYGRDSFLYEIRKTFDSVQKAREWETKVLRRLNVLKKPKVWLNRTNNRAILNETHPRGTLGKTWKNETSTRNNKINKLGNKYTTGTFWVHNGSDRKMLKHGSTIPVGFVRGTGRTNKRPDLGLMNKRKAKRK